MPYRTVLMVVGGGCILAGLCGCEPVKFLSDRAPPAVSPAHIVGTVAEYTRLVDNQRTSVRGYCAVVGLGRNGSAEVPKALERYLEQYLLKLDLGSFRARTKGLSPERFLRSLDTAVVEIRGMVPPGAPVGTRFDVVVVAAPQTQTRSLDGGTLMPADLRLAIGGMSMAGRGTMVMGRAEGSVFVNPFLDPTEPEELVKCRMGRVIGGGVLTKSRPVRLSLRRPDYAICRLIEHRINERFPSGRRVAVAKRSSLISLTIPRERRGDYQEFLKLVMHLPVRAGSGDVEAHARKIAEAMTRPGARHDDLSLVWEAMGRQVISIVRPLYSSRSKAVAFYSARAGMRLGDDIAADVVIRFASNGDSRMRMEAIRELGRHPRVARASLALYRLVDDEDDLVRVAAYEAMLSRGDMTVVTRIDITDEFKLDLVSSHRRPAIYASQSGQQRLVLFGRDMTVQKPAFFSAPDDVVTINANEGDKELMVYRKIPRTGDFSDSLLTDFSLRSLVLTLGSRPERGLDGKIKGIGLTYGQVVGALYRMCKANDIRAKFRLQTLSELRGIYSDTATIGRPDMPED